VHGDLRRTIDTLPALVWRARPDGHVDFFNQRWCDYTGLSLDQACGWGWQDAIHPQDLPALQASWRALLEDGVAGETEARLRRSDGVYRWFLIRAAPLLGDDGKVLEWCGQTTDIDDHRRAEDLLAGEKRLLEMVASHCELPAVLEAVCTLFEEHAPRSRCSILLIGADRATVRHGAAPSLPATYTDAIDGRPVAPEAGPCGMAAALEQQVISFDVADDPRWTQDRWRGLALAHGLRACWSTPIVSRSGEVLGTFGVYWPEPASPSPLHQELIERLTHVASVSIERVRTEAALQESEERFRHMADSIGEVIWIAAIGPERFLYASPSFERIWGRRVEDLYRDPRLWLDSVHPEDRERIAATFSRWIAGADAGYHDVEFRIVRPDGGVRWIHERGVLTQGASGTPVRASGISTDVTAARLAREELEQALHQIERLKDRLQEENIALREEVDRASMFEEIVGTSPALLSVLALISRVAPTDSTVLVYGETGTGKELVARAIHKRSARASGPFVSVNCAAVPSALIASELFGHEKGAFTGAVQRRQGRFELAEGGTIFLDEVGELPPDMQVALLRVLQEREFERVGGSRPLRTDVRVVAATNRDLQAAVAQRSFRADLFYRLDVFPLEMPPLRNRRDDIPLLVEYFTLRYAKRAGKRIRDIGKKTLDLLQAYQWPGNVRELQNVIERAVILSDADALAVDPRWLSGGTEPPGLETPAPSRGTLAANTREAIEAALADSRGRVSGPFGAAEKLGIPSSTLESKIRSLGIDKSRFKLASPMP
jgi:PAS domain S-box-containing protein